MVAEGAILLDRRMRDRLMPMHICVSASGHMSEIGPTLRKLCPGTDLKGRRLLEVFEVVRPAKSVATVQDLSNLCDTTVELRLRSGSRTRLKGVMLKAQDANSLFVNLSFGVSAFAAIEEFGLTNSDFAATDPTIDLLYLKEANNAVTAALQRESRDLARSRAAAREQALTDALTGLGNRRALRNSHRAMAERNVPFSLLQIDLDGFKQVNDTLGHAAGDEVLAVAAGRLRSSVRSTDFVHRTGGDEFVVLLPELTDRNRIDALGKAIIEKLQEPVSTFAGMCRISATIGFTSSVAYENPDHDRMSEDADRALYMGKRAGKGVVVAHRWPGMKDQE